MKRKVFDHKLNLKKIPVRYASGAGSRARAEGNNAAWRCSCGEILMGRCYFQFGDTCFTECPSCQKKFRVTGDERKRAIKVVEEAPASA